MNTNPDSVAQDAPRALSYYQKVVDASEGTKNYRGLGRIYKQMGNLYAYQLIYDEALSMHWNIIPIRWNRYIVCRHVETLFSITLLFELFFVEGEIFAFQADQLLMAALFYHPTVLKYQYQVGIPDGG